MSKAKALATICNKKKFFLKQFFDFFFKFKGP